MTEGTSQQFGEGDHAPVFGCTDSDGNPFELYTHVTGKPMVLIFSGDKSLSDLKSSGFDPKALKTPDIQIATLVAGEPAFAKAEKNAANWHSLTVADPGGEVTNGYGEMFGVKAPSVYILGPNQRVLGIRNIDSANDDLPNWFDSKIKEATFETATTPLSRIAPALIIPRALELNDCDALISYWRKGDKVAGRINLGATAKTRDSVDPLFKRREDFIIDDPAMKSRIMDRLMPRIMPEISKIYHYNPTKMEEFRVGCYKAETAGFFNVHRDNANPSVKDRKFAVTVNLNAGEYEGGDLRFPEYGPELFRPPKGGAVVFSCSMLHEVIPVTKGHRFALLTFIG